MERLGGADEAVERDVKAFPQLLKADDGFVALLLRGNVFFRGGLLDFLAVFVGAGQKKGRLSEQAVEAGEHVGQNRGVGVPDMRFVVDVIDRRGEIKSVFTHWHRLLNIEIFVFYVI